MSEWLEWEGTSEVEHIERHHDLNLMPRTDGSLMFLCSLRPPPFLFKDAVVGIPASEANFLIPASLILR